MRKFNLLTIILLAAFAPLLTACSPRSQTATETAEHAQDEFLVTSNTMRDSERTFDIRDQLVYPEQEIEGLKDPSINVSDEELALNRCSWCHGCGFEDFFDWDDYGTEDWDPQYVGDEWAPSVQRMMDKENAFLKEEMIVRRIYRFLHDVTLGEYDRETDNKGAVEIEVDELPGRETATEEAIENAAQET
jgi:hypothetical protein